eukprot:4945085-Pyramimonas_sp.AAC.1
MAPTSARGVVSASAKTPRPHSSGRRSHGGAPHVKHAPRPKDRKGKHRPTWATHSCCILLQLGSRCHCARSV